MRMHELTRAGRLAGVLLAMLLMALLYAGVAEAELYGSSPKKPRSRMVPFRDDRL
jgi:hypothetical protein